VWPSGYHREWRMWREFLAAQVLRFCCGAEASLWMRREAVFCDPPLWPAASSSLLEGAAGQACWKRWAEVCFSGELGKSWDLVSPSCLMIGNPLRAAAAVLQRARQDRPLGTDFVEFKRNAVWPWLGKASMVLTIKGDSASLQAGLPQQIMCSH